jgi:hypothetical protein
MMTRPTANEAAELDNEKMAAVIFGKKVENPAMVKRSRAWPKTLKRKVGVVRAIRKDWRRVNL